MIVLLSLSTFTLLQEPRSVSLTFSNLIPKSSDITCPPVIVTLLTPKIGYQKAAELFKESLKSGKTIRELVIAKKLLTKKQVDSLLN